MGSMHLPSNTRSRPMPPAFVRTEALKTLTPLPPKNERTMDTTDELCPHRSHPRATHWNARKADGLMRRLILIAGTIVAALACVPAAANADMQGGLFDIHSVAIAPDGKRVYAGQGLGAPGMSHCVATRTRGYSHT